MMVRSVLNRWKGERARRKWVIVVSGLPRSGTSLMMQMLEAGGVPPLADFQRVADDDNPKGYYEFERVKKLPDGDTQWLPQAQGRAVKIITALLTHLPPGYTYRVLLMRRRMEEVLASQRRMLVHRQETSQIDDAHLADLYRRHLAQVEQWMHAQPHVTYLPVDYNALLADPAALLPRIDRFLGGGLDQDRMAAVIDPALYRQRTQG